MKKILKQLLFIPSIARKISVFLATVHQLSYKYLGIFSCAAEGGLHPKHRLMKYHAFFVDNVLKGERVLDVGCGNAALLKDIILKTETGVVGIEMSGDNVEAAKIMLDDFNEAKIVHSDIWEYNGNDHFDIIILSNVLEHIDRRVELLLHLQASYKPNKILIRVPMFEREWPVPYKKEIGVEWRLDDTHKIEYTESEFRAEAEAAGLAIESVVIRWGEMYAVLTPEIK